MFSLLVAEQISVITISSGYTILGDGVRKGFMEWIESDPGASLLDVPPIEVGFLLLRGRGTARFTSAPSLSVHLYRYSSLLNEHPSGDTWLINLYVPAGISFTYDLSDWELFNFYPFFSRYFVGIGPAYSIFHARNYLVPENFSTYGIVLKAIAMLGYEFDTWKGSAGISVSWAYFSSYSRKEGATKKYLCAGSSTEEGITFVEETVNEEGEKVLDGTPLKNHPLSVMVIVGASY